MNSFKTIILKPLICLITFLFLGISLYSLNVLAKGEKHKHTPQESSILIEAWDFYYDKEFDKAIEFFSKEAKAHPKWYEPYDGLGWSYLQKGNFKKAEEYFKSALKIHANYPSSLTGMAEVNAWRYRKFNRSWGYYYKGNFDKAIKGFNMILADKTGRLPKEELWRVQLALGWSYFYKKDYDKAIAHFEKALSLQKNSFDARKGLGFAYIEKGNLDRALKELKASLKILSYQPDVQSKIAWIYTEQDNFKKVIEEYEKARDLNPYLAEPYKALAWAYYDTKEYEKAKEAFIQGIKIYPEYIADDKFRRVLKSRKDWNDMYTVLGWGYYHYGLYKLASEEFVNALKNLGDDAEALRGAGYSFYKLGEYENAVKYSRKSLDKNPNLPPVSEYIQIPGTIATYLIKSDAQSTLGWALYYNGEYDGAIKEFKKVISKHPDWIDAHDGLGWAYFIKKNYSEAEKAFKEALSFNPAYADAINGLTAINQVRYQRSGEGWNYYYRGDYKMALKYFENVLHEKGSDLSKERLAFIYNGMGWCEYRLGNFSKAEKNFETVLAEESDNVDAMVGLGYTLFQSGNYKNAIESLTEALKIDPNNYDALANLGWNYYKTDNFRKAADSFNKAIAINKYLVDPHYGLALSFYRDKKHEKAKEAFETAIDIYPDYVLTDEFKNILKEEKSWQDLRNRLGWSYYYKGLYDKASGMFAAMLKENPTSKDALLGMGSIYYQQGGYRAAINKMEPLSAAKPEKEKGWYKWSHVLSNLGWSYFYTANYDKAMDYFKQLIALHADDDIYADPYSGIGWCLLKKGDKKGAREEFLKAVQLMPGYTSAIDGLAQLDRMG